MATTTNYGWTTPDDTALVKDGAAAIRTLGSSVDTTTKNLNPETTLGDIAYRSSTANVKTRLGIGTTGQVLTVSGGVPAWGSVSSGIAKIASGTFSDVATVDIDSVFSTSYLRYLFTFTTYGNTSSTNYLKLQWRYSSTTETGSNYFYSFLRTDRNSTTNNFGGSSQSDHVLSLNVGGSTNPTRGSLWVGGVGQSSAAEPIYHGTIYDNYALGVQYVGGNQTTQRIYTGLRLTTGATNITGDYAVYGLAL